MSGRQIFYLPYKVLTCLGFWGPRNPSKIVKNCYVAYQIWAYSFITIFAALCIVDLYTFRNDVRKVSTNLSVTFSTVLLLYKNTVALLKFFRIEAFVKKLNKGLYGKINPEDKVIIEHGKKEMKTSCYMIYLMNFCAVTCWMTLPFVAGNRKEDRAMPMPVWIPWNCDKSPYFELAVLFQTYGAYLVSVDALSFNLTVFGFIIQISAEYNLLKANFNKITEWCKRQVGDNPRKLTEKENFYVEEMITKNVQHHQKIIHAVNAVENFYVHIMMLQFTGSGGVVIVVGIDLILAVKAGDSRMITLVAVFALVFSDIFLFCYFGARLKHKAIELIDCVYTVPWEIMNARNRKSVTIILTKSQKLPVMTIEKFVTMDLVTLLTVSKIIYNTIYLILYITESK